MKTWLFIDYLAQDPYSPYLFPYVHEYTTIKRNLENSQSMNYSAMEVLSYLALAFKSDQISSCWLSGSIAQISYTSKHQHSINVEQRNSVHVSPQYGSSYTQIGTQMEPPGKEKRPNEKPKLKPQSIKPT